MCLELFQVADTVSKYLNKIKSMKGKKRNWGNYMNFMGKGSMPICITTYTQTSDHLLRDKPSKQPTGCSQVQRITHSQQKQ